MKMKTSSLAFILLLIGLALSYSLRPLYAQFSGDIDITFTSGQSELAVGDVVELVLSVRHPAGYQVVVPQLPPAWGVYEVRSQSGLETVTNDDGSETTSQTVAVTLFALGTHQTPPIDLSIRDNNGELIERVVPQLSLTVVPILPADDNQLRDIKPQASLTAPIPWGLILALLLALIILTALAWWLYRRFKSRSAPISEPLVTPRFVDNRPIDVITLEELERIERMDLPGQGRYKEYYSLTTDTLRYYLEGMYQVPAIDLTTAETKKALEMTRLSNEHMVQFIDLFSEGDLVKFARFVPGVDSARGLIDRGRKLVIETVIPEVPKAPDDSASLDLETETSTAEAA